MKEPAAPAASAGTVAIGDFTVNRMAFGAMRLTGSGIWGEPSDREEARRVLRHVVKRGVDFIDTADSYGPEVSEEIIAEALHPYPDGLVIATKGGMTRSGPGKWERDGRPEHLREACEGSLRRLRTDCIQLYQLHAVDPAIPLEESVGALVDLQAAGKIRHIGVSNVDVEQLQRAQAVATVVSVQNRYNLFQRQHETVVEACEREKLTFLPWGPLGQGNIGGTALEEIADRLRVSPHQVLLAWLLHRSPIMLVIPGTSSVQHADENLRAADIVLSDEDLERMASVAGEEPGEEGRRP